MGEGGEEEGGGGGGKLTKKIKRRRKGLKRVPRGVLTSLLAAFSSRLKFFFLRVENRLRLKTIPLSPLRDVYFLRK